MSSGHVEAGDRLAFSCCFFQGLGKKSCGAGRGFAGEDKLLWATLLAGGLRQNQTPVEGEGNTDSIPIATNTGRNDSGKTASQEAALVGEERTGEVVKKL